MKCLLQHHHSIILEGLKLLEELGMISDILYSDICSLRTSSNIKDNMDELNQNRLENVVNNPFKFGLEVVKYLDKSLNILTMYIGNSLVNDRWVLEAKKLIGRIEIDITTKVRKNLSKQMNGLYVIIDSTQTRNRSIEKVTREALIGGASVIQLRDKVLDKGELLIAAKKIQLLCRQYNALFIVNDHADLAKIVGSDGLHLGQNDLPIDEARQLIANTQLIGTSNATVEEALVGESYGADYLAVGSIFPTTTKKNTRPSSIEVIKKLKETSTLPVVAIGGINEDNIKKVVHSGADCVCVITAVTLADNPAKAASNLITLMSI